MTEQTAKTSDGRNLYLMDGDAYVVLVGDLWQEVSERLPGRLWYALGQPGVRATGIDFMFNPEEIDEHSGTLLTANASANRAEAICFLHGEPLMKVAGPFKVRQGDKLTIDWNINYDLMA